MATKVEKLQEELKAHLKTAQQIAAKADDEGRDFTDTERAQVTEAMGKADDAKKSLKQAKGDSAIRQAVADLGDEIGLDTKSDGERVTPSGLIVPDGRKSIGQHLVESAEYKALMGEAPNGQFGAKQRVQMHPAGFKSLITGASDTSAGAVVDPQNIGVQVGSDAFQRPLTIRDVVTDGTTGTDAVEYVRVTSMTNNAAPVPEATSTAPIGTGGGTTTAVLGGVKPESAIALQKITTPVKTIAHWIPMTKRAATDAAQVRTLVDGFLQYGLEEELEDQMIRGDSTGENFEGLGVVSGVQAQAWDTNALVTTRKAKTKVRTVGRSIANAYVLNPIDVETMDLLQDNEARFYFGGPGGVGTMVGQALWGLPVIESEAVPQGTGYVGDWRKAILWDREQASIQVTDSHADFFVRNLLAILAEMRAAFGVIQPNAFVKITLSA